MGDLYTVGEFAGGVFRVQRVEIRHETSTNWYVARGAASYWRSKITKATYRQYGFGTTPAEAIEFYLGKLDLESLGYRRALAATVARREHLKSLLDAVKEPEK